MRNYKNYTDIQLIEAAASVKSMAGLLNKLQLKPAGGNYVNMKRNLQRLNIDCSHWTGQAWNKNEQLKNWSKYSKIESVKRHVIKQRGIKCESCLLSEWLSKPISLQLHHLNGDRTNNELSNLQLLCPNCHSFTPNFCGRKVEH